ncbi:MAG: hypothetical protein ACYDCN_13275 [Bacteroidia bacterium]
METIKEKKVNNNINGIDEIENAILKAFEEVMDVHFKLPKSHENRKIPWITKTLKERIGQIGKDKNYKVKLTGDGGEWHYDMVWYQNNEKGCLENVILALESELSDRNPKGLNDFEKLLVSNAEHRVWLCFNKGNSNFPQNINAMIEKFDNSVSAYKNLKTGSRVLVLICADYNTGAIYPHLIIKL